MTRCPICGALLQSAAHELFHKLLKHYPLETSIATFAVAYLLKNAK